MTPRPNISNSFIHTGKEVLTRISITREVARPSHKRVTLMLTRRDRVKTDSADDGRVAEGGLGRDDGIGDVVVDALWYSRQ